MKDKETLMLGAGAGIGVIQTVAFKQYLDPMYGNVPYIGDMLPDPWGKISVLGNILIGGIAFGLTQFTSVVESKNYDLNQFLKIYGITTLIGGIMNGAMYGSSVSARSAGYRLARPIMATTSMAGNLTPTGVPSAKILA